MADTGKRQDAASAGGEDGFWVRMKKSRTIRPSDVWKNTAMTHDARRDVVVFSGQVGSFDGTVTRPCDMFRRFKDGDRHQINEYAGKVIESARTKALMAGYILDASAPEDIALVKEKVREAVGICKASKPVPSAPGGQ